MSKSSKDAEPFWSDAAEALRTVADLVRFGASQFDRAGLWYGHGTDNGSDEAFALTMHALALTPGSLPAEFMTARMTRLERDQVIGLFRERTETRVPAAYIIGKAWFCGLEFIADPRALVPRSPIAELIEAGFAPWIDPESIHRLADVGTGGGCIAVACAFALPDAEIVAIDIDEGALSLARENVSLHGLESHISVQKGDGLAAVTGEFEVIVANPPYVPSAEILTLPSEYRAEPEIALVAGDDGLDVVRRLVADAPTHLCEGGYLFCEVGSARDAFEHEFAGLDVSWVEFERGGDHVFAVEREELVRFKASEEGR